MSDLRSLSNSIKRTVSLEEKVARGRVVELLEMCDEVSEAIEKVRSSASGCEKEESKFGVSEKSLVDQVEEDPYGITIVSVIASC